MYDLKKKYGYIQNNKLSSKNKNKMNDPEPNLLDKRYQNLNLPNQPNIINNQNVNENNFNFKNNENLNNENAEYYDSDIDDPKYRPNQILFNNLNKEILEKESFKGDNINNKLNQEYNIGDQNILRNSRYHNFESFEMPKENFYQNKNILELQKENQLLKQELIKKSEIIRSKDELISEFQNIYNDLKIRFEQYELKNIQLKQHIK